MHCCAASRSKSAIKQFQKKRPLFCRKQASQTWALVIYIYMYIYIYVCVYVVVKVNSFLANLCSIPPRKLQQIPMVVLLQQSVPPIYATCFSKKYSMKLRLLSRTWPNISKLERAVLILRPSMFIAAVVKRLVPASLNA